MKIQTVRDNLKNTIAEKEKILAEQHSALALSYLGPTPLVGTQLAFVAKIQLLEVNIDELNRILADVEKCCVVSTKSNIEDSWSGEVDRQGGSFSQEELNDTGWH